MEIREVELKPGEAFPIPHAQGDCIEIRADIEIGHAGAVGSRFRRSPNGEEQTVVSYDAEKQLLSLDRSGASLDSEVGRSVDSAPLNLPRDEPLSLHVFVDRSVVEIFSGDWKCLTGRIYPTRNDSLGIELFTEGGRAVVKSCRLWRRTSI